jgi:hypothetical protein
MTIVASRTHAFRGFLATAGWTIIAANRIRAFRGFRATAAWMTIAASRGPVSAGLWPPTTTPVAAKMECALISAQPVVLPASLS